MVEKYFKKNLIKILKEAREKKERYSRIEFIEPRIDKEEVEKSIYKFYEDTKKRRKRSIANCSCFRN